MFLTWDVRDESPEINYHKVVCALHDSIKWLTNRLTLLVKLLSESTVNQQLNIPKSLRLIRKSGVHLLSFRRISFFIIHCSITCHIFESFNDDSQNTSLTGIHLRKYRWDDGWSWIRCIEPLVVPVNLTCLRYSINPRRKNTITWSLAVEVEDPGLLWVICVRSSLRSYTHRAL